MTVDVYGGAVDAGVVREAIEATLRAWMPWHLARQEARRGLDPGTLPMPRAWPVVAQDIDWKPGALPALIVVTPGTRTGAIKDRGRYHAVWEIETMIVTAGATGIDAIRAAELMLAAVRGALAQNRTLGAWDGSTWTPGAVEDCHWLPELDRHRAGQPPGGLDGHRAVYASTFAVRVRDVLDINPAGRPTTPPADPHNPTGLPPSPTEAVIEIEASFPPDTEE